MPDGGFASSVQRIANHRCGSNTAQKSLRDVRRDVNRIVFVRELVAQNSTGLFRRAGVNSKRAAGARSARNRRQFACSGTNPPGAGDHPSQAIERGSAATRVSRRTALDHLGCTERGYTCPSNPTALEHQVL
jgi:hypothetical protein